MPVMDNTRNQCSALVCNMFSCAALVYIMIISYGRSSSGYGHHCVMSLAIQSSGMSKYLKIALQCLGSKPALNTSRTLKLL